MDLNPIHHPSPTKTMKCSFLDYVELLIVVWAGQFTRIPSTTCPQSRNEMLIFELRSTSDDQQGWSMDSNPICNPSPAKKMKCLFLDYVQLLMIGQAGQWTQTPSATPLQPKKLNACFWIMFNFWWSARLVMDSNPICNPSPTKKMKCLFFNYVELLMIGQAGRWTRTPSATPLQPKKMKCLFLDYFQFLEISQAGRWTQTPSTTPLQPKNEMLIFGLRSTSDDWSGWSMDLNPICHPSSTKKMKCSFLEHAELFMIGQAGQWTRTPSATPLQPKKWNAHFWIMFNFWWSARLVMDSNPICYPSAAKKKWNACFWIMFNFWWSAGLVNGF